MTEIQSKSAFLYREVRRALRSGRYVPGERIDPATLAEAFHASPTPVRFALYRLVGEGLIADHGRSGLYVPLPTEVVLRDLFDWMRRLLLMACDIRAETGHAGAADPVPDADGDDTASLTWALFDAIARAADQRSLYLAAEQANDRLAPIRQVGQGFFDDAREELAALTGHWVRQDIGALMSGLDAYHERRRQLVPEIVAMLGDASGLPH